MQTDKGGQRGPQSSRQGFGRDNDRRNSDHDGRDSNPNYINTANGGPPPPLPGFGFNFGNMPNMAMFPPGFLNGAGQTQAPGQ